VHTPAGEREYVVTAIEYPVGPASEGVAKPPLCH
jgi:hypothetical protein